MQGNPCYARLFADLTRMSPNPIIASGGCGPRTPGGFSTGCGAPLIGSGALALFMGAGRGISKGAAGLWFLRRPIAAFVHIGYVPYPSARHGPAGGGRRQGASRPARGRQGPSAPASLVLFVGRGAGSPRPTNAAAPGAPPSFCGRGGVPGPGPKAPAPEQARCRALPGSGRVGCAHPPPRRAVGASPAVPALVRLAHL